MLKKSEIRRSEVTKVFIYHCMYVFYPLPEINDKMATACILFCIQSMHIQWLSIFNREYKERKYLAQNYGILRARLLFSDLLMNKVFVY
jgi:hypothetical protein